MSFLDKVKDFMFFRRCTHCGKYPVSTSSVCWNYEAFSPPVKYPVSASIHSNHLCKNCMGICFNNFFKSYANFDPSDFK